MTDFGSDYVLGRIVVSLMKTADALRTEPTSTTLPRLNFATSGVDKNSINAGDTPVPPAEPVSTYSGYGSQLLPPAAAGTAEAPGVPSTFTSEGGTAPLGRSTAPVVQAQPEWNAMTAVQRQERQDQNSRDAAMRSRRVNAFTAGRDQRVTAAQQVKQPGVDAYKSYRSANPLGPDGFRSNMSADDKLRMGANLRANGALKPGGFRDVTDAAIDARVADPAQIYASPAQRQQVALADAATNDGITTTSNGLAPASHIRAALPTTLTPAESRQSQDQAAPVASAPNGLNPNLPTQQAATSTPAAPVQTGASASPQPGAVAKPPSAPAAPKAPTPPSAPTPSASQPGGSGTSSLPFNTKGRN